MKQKTINLPNYWKLMHLDFFAKLFGITEDDFQIVRWETVDGESFVNL